jgi:hypothetical protein
MPRVGVELTIQAFDPARTVHATVIGRNPVDSHFKHAMMLPVKA